MKNENLSLVKSSEDIKASSIYIGYLILKKLKTESSGILILDLYQYLKVETDFTYSGVLYSLIFLYMNGLIEFNQPYIYKTKV